MLSTHQFLAFGLTALVVIAIPGPSVVFVIGRALAYGRGVAVATVIGNTVGLFAAMSLVSVGLGPVVASSIVLFTVLKIVGAAYLVWLGVQAIRHRSGLRADQPGARTALPGPRAARQGFVVGVGNPKGFMLFAALLPQFVDRTTGNTTAQMFTLGILAVVIGLLSDMVWALAASGLRQWFNASPSRGRALGVTGGVSMIGLGIGIAATGHPQ